jgi:PAS domain S-box-containing protein
MLICGLNAAGTIRHVNHALLAATGLAEEDLIGKDWRATLHPQVPSCWLEDVIRSSELAPEESHELTLAASWGQLRRVRWTFTQRRGVDGRLLEIIAIGTRAADPPPTPVPAQPEEMLETPAIRPPDAELEIDPTGCVLAYRAKRPVRHLGPPEQWVGRRIADLLPEHASAALLEAITHVCRTGEPRFIEYPVPDRGETTWFTAAVIAYDDAAASPSRLMVLIRDVTRPKRAEQALRESEDRHRTILDQMQEAVVFADAGGIIQHINAFACDYLNTKREDTVGKHLVDFHPPSVRPQIQRIIDTFRRDPDAQVISRQRPLGDRHLIFRFSPVRDSRNHYRGIIANLIDVTEIHRLESRLQQSERLESVGRLAGGVAHDVNNLMVSVIGLSSLSRKTLGEDHDAAEMLREIEKAGELASNLANQLVAYARTGTHRPSWIDLNISVTRVRDLFARRLPDAVTLATKLDDGLPKVFADPAQMEQVLLNLCTNALEAVESAGSIHIRTFRDQIDDIAAAVHPELVGRTLACLAVSDDGRGMDAETAAKVFEPYFSKKRGGRGLGLATVHGIVRNHGGHVQVDSQPGCGTTITIYLLAGKRREPTAQA